MENNLITAIINLVQNPLLTFGNTYIKKGRANCLEDAFEQYMLDLFAGTVRETNEYERKERLRQCFSFLGNPQNYPDGILATGDAIVLYSIQKRTEVLNLQHMYPRRQLLHQDHCLNLKAKACAPWSEKDLLYVVGELNPRTKGLKNLCLVYGTEYIADSLVYERTEQKIRESIQMTPGIELARELHTANLARIRRVDPMGLTSLLINGTWTIENPFQALRYLLPAEEQGTFQLLCLISEEKYSTLAHTEQIEALVGQIVGLSIRSINVDDPNNPANPVPCRLIVFNMTKARNSAETKEVSLQ